MLSILICLAFATLRYIPNRCAVGPILTICSYILNVFPH